MGIENVLPHQNVLLYEFFHERNAHNASEFIFRVKSIFENALLGSDYAGRLKTVFRIYDTDDGCITAQAVKLKELSATREKVFLRFADKCSALSKSDLRNAKHEIAILTTQMELLSTQISQYALKYLRNSCMHHRENVSLEKYDFGFRIAKSDEVLEMANAINRLERFWFFAFAPTGLCSEKLELVVSVT